MKIGKITLDCASAPRPDVATIECMAHVQLAAIERGADLSIENVSPALRDLIELCGLSEALGVEVQRQPE
jgi:anti-anti-sigma regulatory factor